MKEKMWRPPGYKNPYAKTYRWVCIETGDEGEKPHPSHLVFEAGADAMLLGLYNECQKYGGKWMRFDKADSGDIIVYLDG